MKKKSLSFVWKCSNCDYLIESDIKPLFCYDCGHFRVFEKIGTIPEAEDI